MATPTYGAGIIGAGVIFGDHARAFTQLAPRVRLVGLADVDQVRARRAAQGYFVPFVTSDYHELLRRDDIDIVSVCTPPSLHESMVIDALEAGKYVLCEKPLAHNLASADRILEAAIRHPNRLSVVHQFRYSPEVLRTRWLIDEGHLGKLQFASFTRVGSLPREHRSGGPSWWGKWDVAGGGALMTQCIHELDLALYLLGPVKRVTAMMATIANPIESEDTITAELQHESGALTSVACSLGHDVGFKVQTQILGNKMAVQLPWGLNTSDLGKRFKLEREVRKRFPSGEGSLLPGPLGKVVRLAKRKLGIGQRKRPTGHTPYVAAMVDAIASNSPLPVPPKEARQSLELCMAIYTAAITDQPVDLPLAEDAQFYNGISAQDYQGGRHKSALQEVQR
jgi:UDP-N-acetyl-2-amino-2-deoxyglucuronate dehydrogenase